MSALTRKLILLLVVCITAIGAAAQTRTLSGEVVEKSGDPTRIRATFMYVSRSPMS